MPLRAVIRPWDRSSLWQSGQRVGFIVVYLHDCNLLSSPV
jgi:hypothetical protein